MDLSALLDAIDELEDLRNGPESSDAEVAAAVAKLVLALRNTIESVDTLIAGFEASSEYLSVTKIKSQFFVRLGDLLVIHLVGSAAPAVVPLGILLGIFELTLMPADPAIYQVEYMRQVVRWDRLEPLVSDPGGLIRDVYGWGTADFQGGILIANIARLVEHFVDGLALRALPREVEEKITGHPVPEADTTPAAQLLVSLVKGLGLDGVDVGIALYPLRATTPGGTDGGLGLSPYLVGTTDLQFALSDNLSLEVATTADLEGGVSLVIRAGSDPKFLEGLVTLAGGSAVPASFSFTFAIRPRTTP